VHSEFTLPEPHTDSHTEEGMQRGQQDPAYPQPPPPEAPRPRHKPLRVTRGHSRPGLVPVLPEPMAEVDSPQELHQPMPALPEPPETPS
jgi:hypothetical protein